MAIKCQLVDPKEKRNMEPGDMWYTDPENVYVKRSLSDHYKNVVAKERPPILVMPPGNLAFCVDWRSADGTPWEVTGEPPNLTVHPSIDARPGWHGWLKNGELTPA
ncbi:MAG TPA: DUF6527 family protein [Limnochordia bacterium]|nr:DUF6527 family protein [Limnochordia bacterium]